MHAGVCVNVNTCVSDKRAQKVNIAVEIKQLQWYVLCYYDAM